MTRARAALLLAATALGLTGTSCGDDCGIVDICVPQVAMEVIVSSSASGSVGAVSLQAAGLYIPSESCVVGPDATRCRVMGNPGRYELAVSAPGFATVQRAATVNGPYHCGCASVTTENVVVVLSPVP